MADLERISISLEKPLSAKLAKLLKQTKYSNRSEFIRDLVRDKLVERAWESDEEALGTITLVYDHHKRNLTEKLTGLQHDFHHAVMATTHVHLDHDLCAEMIMVRGKASLIRALADALGKQKGVYHAKLSLSTTGRKSA